MLTIIRYTFKRSMGQILGWGVSMGLIAAYLMVLYKPILEQQAEYKLIFDAYGDTMLAFFGGTIDFVSPAGYLNFVFFSYIPIVAGIFAILIGSGLLVADEEKGTLDLILAHPISRTEFLWGRFTAFCGVTGVILLLTWAGFAIGLPFSGMDTNALTLILPHISLFALLISFGGFALLLSMVMPSRAMAASVSAGLMVTSYLVNSLANMNENLDVLNKFLPMKYYQGGLALNGLDGINLLILLGSALLFVLLSWWLFLQRDIRVSGEGSWRLLAWGRSNRPNRKEMV